MATPDSDESTVVIDPVEEALAGQHELWREHVKDIDASIEQEEAHLKRLRASREEKLKKIAAVKDHLDGNFDGWDIRLAERSGEPRKEKAKRG